MARRSHSSQNHGHNSRDRYEDTPEYDTEDFEQDDYDAYNQGAYQPRTLGSVRSAGASSARNNHESHGSRFTREPLIGQTNVGDEWPEEAPAQQQKHTHFAAHRAGAVSHAPSRAKLYELLAHIPASHVEAGIFCGRFVSMQHKDAKLRIVDV